MIFRYVLFIGFSLLIEELHAQVDTTIRVCQGTLPDTLYASDTGIAYLWNTGDTLPYLVIYDTGKYAVLIEVDSVTSITDSFMVLMRLPAVAKIVLNTEHTPLTIRLFPQVQPADSDNLWTWITPFRTYGPEPDSSGIGYIDFCEYVCSWHALDSIEVILIVENECGIDKDSVVLRCEYFCHPLSIDEPFTSVVEDTVWNADNAIQVFPNPTSDRVTVRSNTGRIHSLTVVDVQGKQVAFIAPDDQTVELDTRAWPAGMYLIIARSENERVSTRLVKQ